MSFTTDPTFVYNVKIDSSDHVLIGTYSGYYIKQSASTASGLFFDLNVVIDGACTSISDLAVNPTTKAVVFITNDGKAYSGTLAQGQNGAFTISIPTAITNVSNPARVYASGNALYIQGWDNNNASQVHELANGGKKWTLSNTGTSGVTGLAFAANTSATGTTTTDIWSVDGQGNLNKNGVAMGTIAETTFIPSIAIPQVSNPTVLYVIVSSSGKLWAFDLTSGAWTAVTTPTSTSTGVSSSNKAISSGNTAALSTVTSVAAGSSSLWITLADGTLWMTTSAFGSASPSWTQVSWYTQKYSGTATCALIAPLVSGGSAQVQEGQSDTTYSVPVGLTPSPTVLAPSTMVTVAALQNAVAIHPAVQAALPVVPEASQPALTAAVGTATGTPVVQSALTSAALSTSSVPQGATAVATNPQVQAAIVNHPAVVAVTGGASAGSGAGPMGGATGSSPTATGGPKLNPAALQAVQDAAADHHVLRAALPPVPPGSQAALNAAVNTAVKTSPVAQVAATTATVTAPSLGQAATAVASNPHVQVAVANHPAVVAVTAGCGCGGRKRGGPGVGTEQGRHECPSVASLYDNKNGVSWHKMMSS